MARRSMGQSKVFRLATLKRIIALAWLGAALAACGSDDDDPGEPVAASRGGHLLVLNADESIISCEVDGGGEPGVCQMLAPPASTASSGGGGVELDGSRVYFSDMAEGTITECRLDDNGEVVDCETSPRQIVAAPMGKAKLGDYLIVAGNDDTLGICDMNQTASPDTACVTSTAGGLLSQPFSVAASRSHFFVSNVREPSIVSCHLDDQAQAMDCQRFAPEGMFKNPTGLTIDGGRLYVTASGDESIVVCDVEAGAVSGCEKFTDPVNLRTPMDIAVNGSKAYVASLWGYSVALCELRESGRISACEALFAPGLLTYPGGLVFAPAEN